MATQNLKITISSSVGDVIERDMLDTEIEELTLTQQDAKAARLAADEQIEAAKNKKIELLAKLGLTEEEAQAFLG